MTKQSTPEVPIHCAHAEVWPLEKLVENPRNPNKHPEPQLRLLGKVIAQAGWRSPIVVSKRSGHIVKGHGRFQAALMAGMTCAPVDLQDYATAEDELADMIADNRLAELAEIALPDLKDLLQELDTGAFNMDLTGFDEAAMAELMTAVAPEQNDDEDKGAEAGRITCPKCGHSWQNGHG
jgi:ParB-like chromosome segregation protein Spo0J